MTRAILLALVALAVLAAPAAAKQPTLTGQTWQTKGGLTAAFTTSGAVSGFSGCNTYSGTYKTSGSSITVAKNLTSTQKACPRAVMTREHAFLAALTAARSYSIAKSALTLKGKRGTALLTFAVQSQALDGTVWNVTGYNNGKGAVTSAVVGTHLTAAFDKGTIFGSAGCNEYNGPVKGTPPAIAIGPLAATRKTCESPSGVMTQETAFLTALQTAATYSIQGATLELRTKSGALAVTMTRG